MKCQVCVRKVHMLDVFNPHPSSCEAGVLQCQTVDGCLVDGGWSQWAAWSECSLPCGGGAKLRHRQCDNPGPQSGGRGCAGVAEQQKDCNAQNCTGEGQLKDCSTHTCTGEGQQIDCNTHTCTGEGQPKDCSAHTSAQVRSSR